VTPLHVPPQVPLPLQGVRGVVTGTQVPLFDALRQDSHCPLHVALQHTPSAPQTPLMQSLPVPVHAVPFAFPTQTPFEHTGVLPLQPPQHSLVPMHPALHCFCPVGHDDRHEVVPDWQPRLHVIMADGVQAPAPLQRAAVMETPPVQDAAAPHDVVVPG